MQPIVEDVRQKGDAAVRLYTKRFDKVDLEDICIPIEVCLLVPAQLRVLHTPSGSMGDERVMMSAYRMPWIFVSFSSSTRSSIMSTVTTLSLLREQLPSYAISKA